MKRTVLLAYTALFITFFVPFMQLRGQTEAAPPLESPAMESPLPAESQPLPAPPQASTLPEESSPPETSPAPAIEPAMAESPAPEEIVLLLEDGRSQSMDMDEYVLGVLAAEMPAGFEPEALKAQAVAARTYAMYCAAGNKHGSAQVCADFGCCQAWISQDKLRENWGGDYEKNLEKLRSAVSETSGEYLSYEGAPVFAAFHSSSAGKTEDCGQVWNPRPYLVSVDSPETAQDVPNYISRLDCAPLDFRDTVLSACPEADFSGDEAGWIGEIVRDDSGRVASAELGGVKIKGTELRSLFSLRSTAFTLEYSDGRFIFTVTGFGHGVGMSQYGANVMAKSGAGYAGILTHYYPGAALVK